MSDYYSIQGVNAPKDVIDVAENLDLPFTIANALKYLVRAGKKQGEPEEKDLRKAIECIHRRIVHLDKLRKESAAESEFAFGRETIYHRARTEKLPPETSTHSEITESHKRSK
jgi:hypothetical protein